MRESLEPARKRVFQKMVQCRVCRRDFHFLREGHRITETSFTCNECSQSKYDCPVCMDSGHILNMERVRAAEEAGPGTPSVWDLCPNGCVYEP